jgi:zinc protease
VSAGDENYLPRDLARYRAVTAEQVRDAVARWLRDRGRIVLTVSPRSAHAK